jgi:hypothetical protein
MPEGKAQAGQAAGRWRMAFASRVVDRDRAGRRRTGIRADPARRPDATSGRVPQPSSPGRWARRGASSVEIQSWSGVLCARLHAGSDVFEPDHWHQFSDARARAGEVVGITLWRDGQPRHVEFTTVSQPARREPRAPDRSETQACAWRASLSAC